MRNTITAAILVITVGILITTSAFAIDERNVNAVTDAHWRYFGPAPTDDWTAARPLPAKRSLEQSIRHDALRHYETNSFELSESGQVISFTEKPEGLRGDAHPRPANRQPDESPPELFELAESGQVISFSEKAGDFRGEARLHTANHQPHEPSWEVFELAESGQTIVFPKTKKPARVDANVVARQDATTP